jgi:5'-nucleotidase
MKKPDIIKNKAGKDVVINQVGWAGIMMGQIDVSITREQTTILATQYLIR